MDIDQSLRDSLNQLVNLQHQQLNEMRNLSQSAQADTRNNSPNLNSYQNYAPNFMPPMVPRSGYTEGAINQYQAYKEGIPGQGFFANKSTISYQNQQMANASQASAMSNAAIAGAGATAGLAADFGLAALAPGLGSAIALGAVGGAAVGGVFSVGLQQNKQHMAINEYLLKESYRMVDPRNSTNTKDIAGFSSKERFQAADFLRHFNTQEYISDNDTMTLLDKFTSGGLLNNTNNLENFEKKMSELTKYVKKSALVLNSTFEEVADLMSEMDKRGISSKNFDYMASKSKVVGAFTGMDASRVMQSSYNIASGITAGTDTSVTNMMSTVEDNLLYTGELFKKSKEDPSMNQIQNIIKNLGGTENATNVITQYQSNLIRKDDFSKYAILFHDYDAEKGGFDFNKSKFDEFMESGYSMEEVSDRATNALMSLDTAGQINWDRSGDIVLNTLTGGQQSEYIDTMLDKMKKTSGLKGDTKDALAGLFRDKSQEALLYGEFLDFKMEDDGKLLRQAGRMTLQQDIMAKAKANNPGFGGWLQNTFWEKPKDYIGDVFTPIGEGFATMNQWVSDFWYGKNFTIDRGGITADFTQEDIERETGNVQNVLSKFPGKTIGEAISLMDEQISSKTRTSGKATDMHEAIVRDYNMKKDDLFKGAEGGDVFKKLLSDVVSGKDGAYNSINNLMGLIKSQSSDDDMETVNRIMADFKNMKNPQTSEKEVKDKESLSNFGKYIQSYGLGLSYIMDKATGDVDAANEMREKYDMDNFLSGKDSAISTTTNDKKTVAKEISMLDDKDFLGFMDSFKPAMGESIEQYTKSIQSAPDLKGRREAITNFMDELMPILIQEVSEKDDKVKEHHEKSKELDEATTNTLKSVDNTVKALSDMTLSLNKKMDILSEEFYRNN